MTILKFVGLGITTMIVTAIIYRREVIGTLSLYAVAQAIISIVLLFIYILT